MKQQNFFIVVIIIALGSFLFDYDISMLSGTTSQIESLLNLISLWFDFIVSIAIIGTIIETIIGKSAEKYSRKKSLTLLCKKNVSSWCCTGV